MITLLLLIFICFYQLLVNIRHGRYHYHHVFYQNIRSLSPNPTGGLVHMPSLRTGNLISHFASMGRKFCLVIVLISIYHLLQVLVKWYHLGLCNLLRVYRVTTTHKYVNKVCGKFFYNVLEVICMKLREFPDCFIERSRTSTLVGVINIQVIVSTQLPLHLPSMNMLTVQMYTNRTTQRSKKRKLWKSERKNWKQQKRWMISRMMMKMMTNADVSFFCVHESG